MACGVGHREVTQDCSYISGLRQSPSSVNTAEKNNMLEPGEKDSLHLSVDDYCQYF